MMKRVQMLSTGLIFLVASGTATLQAQGRGRGRGEDQTKQDQQDQKGKVPPQEQQRRVQQEQQRATTYQKKLDQQTQVVQRQAAQLEQQKRAAQARTQQEYAAQLAQQREHVQASRDYAHDPYITTPHTYRYTVSGTARETNQYGVDVLRQAVNNGYQQGYRTGQADRQDHWRSDYQNSPAYRDANFGYSGNYVDESDYNYYFRQGFRKGYDDGYNSRFRYGSNSNGSYSILSNVLNGILGLVTIH
jgi:hypothetical protein